MCSSEKEGSTPYEFGGLAIDQSMGIIRYHHIQALVIPLLTSRMFIHFTDIAYIKIQVLGYLGIGGLHIHLDC